MDPAFAQRFAHDWVAAWNAHDLDAILAHYAEDFEMASPVIVHMQVNASGVLTGKSAVRAYWQKALQRMPDLRFELLTVLVGVQSITLYYRGARDRLAAEVFHFNAQGQVTRAMAHEVICRR